MDRIALLRRWVDPDRAIYGVRPLYHQEIAEIIPRKKEAMTRRPAAVAAAAAAAAVRGVAMPMEILAMTTVVLRRVHGRKQVVIIKTVV